MCSSGAAPPRNPTTSPVDENSLGLKKPMWSWLIAPEPPRELLVSSW